MANFPKECLRFLSRRGPGGRRWNGYSLGGKCGHQWKTRGLGGMEWADMQFLRSIVTAGVSLLSGLQASALEPWQAADSPFVLGEAYPEVPATCDTVGHWIDKAPDIDARVSFAIVGKLTMVEWDGALAYLVMCQESQVQVLCVTYSRDGRDVGDTVLFGGGFARAGERQIMLDPCLAGPAN